MPPKKDSKTSSKQPQKTQKKKEGSGGKAKKKKWSKGKVRDKLNNQVLIDDAMKDKIMKEVPSCKLLTPSILCERFKVCVSLSRCILKEMKQSGHIRLVSQHSKQVIYTRVTKCDDQVA